VAGLFREFILWRVRTKYSVLPQHSCHPLQQSPYSVSWFLTCSPIQIQLVTSWDDYSIRIGLSLPLWGRHRHWSPFFFDLFKITPLPCTSWQECVADCLQIFRPDIFARRKLALEICNGWRWDGGGGVGWRVGEGVGGGGTRETSGSWQTLTGRHSSSERKR
jgi:hypothetical protein